MNSPNSASAPNDQDDFKQSEDRTVERTFIFVRTTILLAVFAGIGLLGWTAHVVNNGTSRMFDAPATNAELAMPAEGPGETPDWTETFQVTSISASSVPPVAIVNGRRVTEGESVRVETPEGMMVTARVVKIANGMVELKPRGEHKSVRFAGRELYGGRP